MLLVLPDPRGFPLVLSVLGIEHSHGAFDEASESSPGHTLSDFQVSGPLHNQNTLLVEVSDRAVDPYDRRRQRLTLPYSWPSTVSDDIGHGQAVSQCPVALSTAGLAYVCAMRPASSTVKLCEQPIALLPISGPSA
jgi:hypothetical protein